MDPQHEWPQSLILPQEILLVRKFLLAPQKQLHPVPIQKTLTIARRLVRHVPHGGPRCLHDVIAVAGLQLLPDDEEHLLDGAEAADQPLLVAVHLAGQAVQQ
jgi:hypothetical protein